MSFIIMQNARLLTWRPTSRNSSKALSFPPMRTASGTGWRNPLWSRAELFPPLDPTSRQLEQDADATMTVDKAHGYTGQHPFPAPG